MQKKIKIITTLVDKKITQKFRPGRLAGSTTYVTHNLINLTTITVAATAALKHLTYHIVENSSMMEIQQLHIGVKTNRRVKTSPTTDLYKQ